MRAARSVTTRRCRSCANPLPPSRPERSRLLYLTEYRRGPRAFAGTSRVGIVRFFHIASLCARAPRIADSHRHFGNSSPPSQLNEPTTRPASPKVDTEGLATAPDRVRNYSPNTTHRRSQLAAAREPYWWVRSDSHRSVPRPWLNTRRVLRAFTRVNGDG